MAVLVVDDHPQVRGSFVDAFNSLGFKVFDAYRADEGLGLLRAHPEISLLFADVRLPGMNGVDLVAEARRMRPDLKVILTSGYRDEIEVPSGVPFLSKPWRLKDLVYVLVDLGLAPADTA
jgi:CheY-like chemotaxis protein